MRKGGDIIAARPRARSARWRGIKRNLPVGVEVHQVSDQPTVVARSVNEFMRTLARGRGHRARGELHQPGVAHRRGGGAVHSAGARGDLPWHAEVFGIDLQRISLGALIIALGLLVDDAIIAVEMMAIKMEQGWDRLQGGELRLHLDGAVHAHRHAGDRGRLPARWGWPSRPPANTRSRSSRWSRSRCWCPGSSRCCSRRTSATSCCPICVARRASPVADPAAEPDGSPLAPRLAAAGANPGRSHPGTIRPWRRCLRHAVLPAVPRAGDVVRDASARP